MISSKSGHNSVLRLLFGQPQSKKCEDPHRGGLQGVCGLFHKPCWRLCATTLALSAGLIGCASSQSHQPSSTMREAGQQLFSGASQGSRGGAIAGRWTIVLGAFGGENARRQAEARLDLIRTQTVLKDVAIEERRSSWVVTYGGYPTRQDDRAARDLKMIRGLTMGGQLAFRSAFISPRAAAIGGGSIPELNLGRAHTMFGPDVIYTLQVAVYESPDHAEAMRAAEQAALELRQEGELAFYYHGPTRSMVTIGLFREKDFNIRTGLMSPELVALRERRAYNLYNGKGIRESIPGGPSRLQPSQLVQIP